MGQKPANAPDRRAFMDGPEGQAMVDSAGAALAARVPLFAGEVRGSYTVNAECDYAAKKSYVVRVKFLAAPAVVLQGAAAGGDGRAVLLATCTRVYVRPRSKAFRLESAPGCEWDVDVEFVRTSVSDTGEMQKQELSEAAVSSLMCCARGDDDAMAGVVARVEAAAATHEANPDIAYSSLQSLRSCGLSTIIWEREDGDYDVAHYEGLGFSCGYICPKEAAKKCHTFRLPSNSIT